MIKRALLFLILSAFLASHANAAETTAFKVVTEKGRVLRCNKVKFGFFKVLSSRGKGKASGKSSHSPHYGGHMAGWKFVESTVIPRREGDSFGVEFLVPKIGKKDTLIIKAVIEVPARKSGVKKLSETFKYKSKESNLMRSVRWTFDTTDGENKDVAKKGVFKLSLYNKDKLLISKTFKVVAK